MKLKWLDKKARIVRFGLPHAKGEIKEGVGFSISGAKTVTRPLAFWRDGSVKWTAHTAIFEGDIPDSPRLEYGAEELCGCLAEEREESYFVDTGKICAEIPKRGEKIVKGITAGGVLRVRGANLVVLNENRYESTGIPTTAVESFFSRVDEAYLEENTAISCIIRLKGAHISAGERYRSRGKRLFLPFDLRMYFYSGTDEIKIIHTFLFNGAADTDFIKGIGLRFDLTASGALYNRYVRFAGERGIYTDSPKSLLTWRTTGKYKDLYARQNNAEPVCFDAEKDAVFLGLLDESAVWNDFKITQLSSEEYSIQKRVGKNLVYIKGHMGRRALGLCAFGDAWGGFAAHMSDFWQKYPSGMEICGAAGDEPYAMLWLWSPDAQPMDLRHYDTATHVYSAYEGFEELRATPYGIANTNEMSVKITDYNITNAGLLEYAGRCGADILLAAEPGYYAGCGVLGDWEPENRTDTLGARIEEQADALLEIYKRERETRRWYGFWDYGDFMHTYDDVSNCWKYDMGGQAWQNTELVPNLWLWYGFLRTTRADYFSLAKAMTRHTSEVDMYHIGEYARLGSRHNVVHWGCGCKESRISMAHMHKIYYYLTADERVGDILDEVVDADFAVGELDPMRAGMAPSADFKTHVRFSPDVMSFCSNWFTYWERHRSQKYYDKLIKTLEFFKRGYRFAVSGVYGYNPGDTEYFDFEPQGGSHFMLCHGSFFVWREIADALDDEEINEQLVTLGRFYGTHGNNINYRAEKFKEWGFDSVLGESRYKHASYNVAVSAYAAAKTGDDGLAAEIKELICNDLWLDMPPESRVVDCDNCHKILTETAKLSTNAAAQWAVNAFAALKYLKK